jgi:RNA polymerase sigma-70 factor (ECF subfamily)
VVDKELIQAVKAKNNKAFKHIYDAYVRYVYTIVSLYVGNESDYQDVIQEIFARVFLKIDAYDPEKGDFKHWIRKLSINQCIKYYHKNKRQVETQSIDSNVLRKLSADGDKQEISKEELRGFLKTMPSGYKEVFMLVVIDEYTHKEVGEMLNISPETSRSQLHRAKQWLKENLSKNTLNLMTTVI